MNERAIAIRRATLDDAAAIADVHVASWRTTYPGIVDQAYIDGLSAAERAIAWARRLSPGHESAPGIFVATTRDQKIIGFISGGVIREPILGFDAEIYAIYLLESVQRAGVGRRLMREWAGVATDRDLHAAIVRVLARNPACQFYERLGAELLRETELVIGGKSYPERWYGWRNLVDLTV